MIVVFAEIAAIVTPVFAEVAAIFATVFTEITPFGAAPMGVAPAAVPMAIAPAKAFAAIPGEVRAVPAIPDLPAAAIPEVGPAVIPAIIMRPADGDAAEHDGALIDR